jgi:hypothetical protein
MFSLVYEKPINLLYFPPCSFVFGALTTSGKSNKKEQGGSMNTIKTYMVMLLGALLLVGCGGGGGGGGGSTQAKDVAGVYTGTDDSSTALTTVIRPNGDYWIFYVPSGDGLIGVITGNGTAKGSPDYTFNDSDGKDFQESTTNQPIVTSNLETTYVSETSLSGTLSENSSVVSTFALSYQSTTVTLADLTGDFSGGLVQSGGSASTTMAFQNDGSFSASVDGGGPSACAATGTASVQDGTHYKVTVHIATDATNCQDVSGKTGTGIAYLNKSNGELFMFFKSSDNTLTALFDLNPT